MKKNFNFSLLSAIALAGGMGFTACSTDNDVEEATSINPTYDAATGLVKSQFVLNIASNAQTRSGGTTVQAGGANFRGIDNAMLFAFKTNGKRFVDATFAAAAAANRYDLGTVAAASTLNNSDKSHRILELAMPTGTDAMLFYGKAIKGSSDPDYNEIGKVSYNVTGSTATDFNFNLTQRVVSADVTRYQYTADVLAAVLTQIINSEASYTVAKTGTGRIYPDWAGDATISTTWKELTTTTRTLMPLEEILKKAFIKLTTIRTTAGITELRGGSSKAIITTIKDLKSVSDKVANATPTSPYEELAQRLAAAINIKIGEFFTTNTTTGVVEALQAKSTIKQSMGNDWDDAWDIVDNAELANYPIANFNLPEGAAQLTYDDTNNKFDRKASSTSLLDRTNTTDPRAYQYPAELMYYCNSGVRTSNVEKNETDYPNGVTYWDTEAQWTGKGWEAGGTTVTSATRATAMTKNVNYGVAMLQTTVGFKSGMLTIEDNRATLNDGEDNQSFDVSALNLKLTGVIIGGQSATVDWQFLPKATGEPSAQSYDKIVYDDRIAGNNTGDGVAVPVDGGTSSPNYTILFDNWINDANQNKVRVALQFTNSGADFWGRDNIIRKDQTFYLVAELDPAGKTLATWDANYQVPPLTSAGASTQTVRVFIQDFMTTANFKFSENSLKSAFVTLPDLRSSQLSFGLSVDLNWKQGIVFEADLGGN